MSDAQYELTLADVKHHDRAYLETIFSLGNGQIGIRAGLPTNDSQKHHPGMLINGFYGTTPIEYGEKAVGYADNHQTIMPLFNPKAINIVLSETDQLSNHDWQITLKETTLKMRENRLVEQYELISSQGVVLHLGVETLLACDRNAFSLLFDLSAPDYRGPIKFERLLIEQGQHEKVDDDDPRIANRELPIEVSVLPGTPAVFNWQTTSTSSGQTIVQQEMVGRYPEGWQVVQNATGFQIIGTIAAQHRYQFGFDRAIGRINQTEKVAANFTDDELLVANQQALDVFWHQSDVVIEGNDVLQKGIRYNIFQLYQSAGRDGRTNIAAKGVSGAGYEGHYFWDTEMYMLPFFSYTNPKIAKQLLLYRYHILEEAKKRAQTMGGAGALFPWRTISGQELSAYYPAGTAQVHIDGDIAYAVKQYYEITKDEDFLNQFGAEIVIETAKFWLSYGSWFEKDNQRYFGIFKVTGPDEYTALVNNNYYTNRIAQENMRFAQTLLGQHKGPAVENSAQLVADLKVAADAMYLPYDQVRQIKQQDDESPLMPTWPFEKTPKDHYPLLLHYHPLMIYRHRVNKQADTLLSDMLFQDDIDVGQLTRDFDYYRQITTHDSSLSRSIFGIIASRLDRKDAYDYYIDSALMDLTDLQGNTSDGLHAANMGGSWLGIVYGFANLHIEDNQLVVESHLPTQLKTVRFRVSYQRALLQITLQPNTVAVERLNDSAPIQIKVAGNVKQI